MTKRNGFKQISEENEGPHRLADKDNEQMTHKRKVYYSHNRKIMLSIKESKDYMTKYPFSFWDISGQESFQITGSQDLVILVTHLEYYWQ